MKTHFPFICLVAIAVSGCVTLVDERRSDADNRDTDMAVETERAKLAEENAKVALERIQDRLDAVEKGQQDLEKDVQALRATSEKNNHDSTDSRAAAEQLTKSNEVMMARFKQDIIDSVAKNMSEMIRSQQPPAPAPRVAKGREHVVERGETLSVIAAAYKVKSSAIIAANGLKDANSIRVGQKLFIPDTESATVQRSSSPAAQ
jgi:LysM repeat protein